VTTGEVEISPVFISHKNFNVAVNSDEEEPPSRFFAVDGGQARQSPLQLQQLQSALKALRVPNEDVIAIIRELH
jgi:flagellar basal body P-ring protein FlgI